MEVDMTKEELETEIKKIKDSPSPIENFSNLDPDAKKRAFQAWGEKRNLLDTLETLKRKTLSKEELQDLEEQEEESDSTEAGFNENEYNGEDTNTDD